MVTDNVGPVELAVLSFPTLRVPYAVVQGLREVVDQGLVTVVDLVYLAKNAEGEMIQVEVDQPLGDVGLDELTVDPSGLISDEDLDIVRDLLEPGSSAVVIVYEETWARNLAGTVRDSGGELALQVQVPRDAVEAALAASQEVR
ncbi:hypothetical protein NONO_c67240 [Nocardia nova SH22a]|uniref:DUF1269 domain-containing protein n=1 Tax=Nocardia nova SH22a TaxID=1415166 RepID=W5TWE2_9NOCA|nr:DUF6325 family protein [Nocardia nova]AHH21491.1 hypothetical protein NONO_c67240 [Nocardia nova SH22a]